MRVAVITGAAQGIGRRIAEVIAARGYALALNDLRSPAETIAAAREHGVDAIELVGDISDDAVVDGFAKTVLVRWGRVDVLVNNAGISCIARAEQTAPQEFRRVLEVNLVAPFLMVRAFGPAMLSARSGSIVNIASIAGLLGIAERSAYNASKHGLIGLTRTLPPNGAAVASGRMRCAPVGSKQRWMRPTRPAAATPTPTSPVASRWDVSPTRRMSPTPWRSWPIRSRADSSTELP